MEYLAQCTRCSQKTDVKTKTRLAKIRKDTYRCKPCIIQGRTYQCPRCKVNMILSNPRSKRIAEQGGLICKTCQSTPETFTDEQNAFLTGLMLGDASISYSSEWSVYPRLTTRRQIKDVEYLNWQHRTFLEFYKSGPAEIKQYDNRTGKTYEAFYLQSRSSKLLQNWRECWYPEGKKIVPRDLQLSPLTLLVWFLDDGCIVKKSENNLTLKISTDGFPPEDVLFLSRLLSDYLQGPVNMYRNGKGYILKASTKTTKKFIEIISPIFPDFMSRKQTW